MSSIWSIKLCGKEPTIPPCGQPNTSGFNRKCNFFPDALRFVLSGIANAVKKFVPTKAGDDDCGAPRGDDSCCKCQVTAGKHWHGKNWSDPSFSWAVSGVMDRGSDAGVPFVVTLMSYGARTGLASSDTFRVAVQKDNAASIADISAGGTRDSCNGTQETLGCKSCEDWRTEFISTTNTPSFPDVEYDYIPKSTDNNKCSKSNWYGGSGGRDDKWDRFTLLKTVIQDTQGTATAAQLRTNNPDDVVPALPAEAKDIQIGARPYYDFYYYTVPCSGKCDYCGVGGFTNDLWISPTFTNADPVMYSMIPHTTRQIKDNLFITGNLFGGAMLWRLDASYQFEIIDVKECPATTWDGRAMVPTVHPNSREGVSLIAGETYRILSGSTEVDYSNVTDDANASNGTAINMAIGDYFVATNSTPLTSGQSVESYDPRGIAWDQGYNIVDGAYRGLSVQYTARSESNATCPADKTFHIGKMGRIRSSLYDKGSNKFEYVTPTRYGYCDWEVDSVAETLTFVEHKTLQSVSAHLAQQKTTKDYNVCNKQQKKVTNGTNHADASGHIVASGDATISGRIYTIYYGGEGEDYSSVGGPSLGAVGDAFFANGATLSGNQTLLLANLPSISLNGWTASIQFIAVDMAFKVGNGSVLATFSGAHAHKWKCSPSAGCGNSNGCDALIDHRWSSLIYNAGSTSQSLGVNFYAERTGWTSTRDNAWWWALPNPSGANCSESIGPYTRGVNAASEGNALAQTPVYWADKFDYGGDTYVALYQPALSAEIVILKFDASPSASMPYTFGEPIGKASSFPEYRSIDRTVAPTATGAPFSVFSQKFKNFNYSQISNAAEATPSANAFGEPNLVEAPIGDTANTTKGTDRNSLSQNYAVITLGSECTYGLRSYHDLHTINSKSRLGGRSLEKAFGAFGP